MGKGFKSGGGGASPLNFKVLGGATEPTNLMVNTVWVNTDAEITGWIFSATQPTDTYEGLVWLVTSTSGSVSFNALKKNGIQIYMIGAKQYISGTWVTKEVKYSEGTNWEDVILYFYNRGDDCSPVTGGWETTNYRYNPDNQSPSAPTLSMGESAMSITFKKASAGSSTSGTTYYGGSVWTKKPIDLTDVSTVYITVDSYSDVSDPGNVYFIATKKKTDEPSAAASVTLSERTSARTYSLNVKNLSGEYYFALMNKSNYQAITLKISVISGE